VGPIDVPIDNAGYGHEGVLEESPLVELFRQFEVNVFAAVLLGRDAVKLVKERLAALDEQIKAWEPISCSTDYT